MLDQLIGREPINKSADYSPFKKYLDISNPDLYVKLLANLVTLRAKVLEANPKAKLLKDMIEVIDQYKTNDIKIYNNSPILSGNIEGVQLLTGHKAKGLEFENVIILSAVEKIWGNNKQGNHLKIALPENLILYPAGDAKGDLIRILYVALT
jgi:superfamily I DNA/RNA helicase